MLQKASLSIPFEEKGVNVSLVQVCTGCFYGPNSLDEKRMVTTLTMAEEWKMPENTARKAAKAIIEEARKKVIPPEPLFTERMLSPALAA
ncbi:MAG: hypothetical protein Q8P08_02680 [bacterium]|nr:hypothetical protein [bacterium]